MTLTKKLNNKKQTKTKIIPNIDYRNSNINKVKKRKRKQFLQYSAVYINRIDNQLVI